MNSTEIDAALRHDDHIEPSSAFRAQVMRAVHARAMARRPRVSAGRIIWPVVGAASVGAALPMMAMLLERSGMRSDEAIEVVRWLSISVSGTLAIAWRSMRRLA